MFLKPINTRIIPFFFVLTSLLKGSEVGAQDNNMALQDADRFEKLAAYHLGLNDFNYSEELLSKTLLIRKKYLSKAHPLTIATQIELARITTKTNRPQRGIKYIEEALILMERLPDNYKTSLHAKASFVKALILYNKKEFKKAKTAYEHYHNLVGQNPKLQKTDFYLSSLIQTSSFYSGLLKISLNRQWGTQAFYYAQLAYKKSSQNPYRGTLFHLQSIYSLGRINCMTSNYKNCLSLSREGQKVANGILNETSNTHERIKFEKYLAMFLFEESVSTFFLTNGEKDENQLKEILHRLERTLAILERNKSVLQDQKDVILILEDYFKYITRFMDYLCISIYRLTKDDQYIDELIKYHESGLYNNIRSRLLLKNIDFKNLSESVRIREENLHRKIEEIHNEKGDRSNTKPIEKEFSVFLDSLKHYYPEYYTLKYGPFIRPIEQISEKLPKGTSVVRYFYSIDRLYAIVIDSDSKALVELPYINISLYQNEMVRFQDSRKLSKVLFELYDKLWRPLEKIVKTEDVIIIPESNLFNINFEALTFSEIDSLEELAEKSLLSRHNISYNYSLFLIDKDRPVELFDNEYIGFAPEFNKTMKEKYKMVIEDDINLDKSYLTLLPQPWTLDLTEASSKLFDGTTYTNEKASKQVFTQTAKGQDYSYWHSCRIK